MNVDTLIESVAAGKSAATALREHLGSAAEYSTNMRALDAAQTAIYDAIHRKVSATPIHRPWDFLLAHVEVLAAVQQYATAVFGVPAGKMGVPALEAAVSQAARKGPPQPVQALKDVHRNPAAVQQLLGARAQELFDAIRGAIRFHEMDRVADKLKRDPLGSPELLEELAAQAGGSIASLCYALELVGGDVDALRQVRTATNKATNATRPFGSFKAQFSF